MSTRRLVILGTASQVPTKLRANNAVVLLWDGDGILFDPGEGTQRQLAFAGISAHQLNHIALTHLHGDHCLGLPGVIQRLSLDDVSHTTRLFFPASGQTYISRLRYASSFVETAKLDEHPFDSPGPLARVGKSTLSTAELAHTIPAWGYRLQAPDEWRLDPAKLAALGLHGPEVGLLKVQGFLQRADRRIEVSEVGTLHRGQAVAVVMDTRMCESALTLARGVDTLVCESTFLASEQEQATAWGHMTTADAGKLAAKAGVKRLVLTHFSRRYPLQSPFADEAAQHFSGEIFTGSDLLEIDLRHKSPEPRL